jgi:hypothetical protein
MNSSFAIVIPDGAKRRSGISCMQVSIWLPDTPGHPLLLRNSPCPGYFYLAPLNKNSGMTINKFNLLSPHRSNNPAQKQTPPHRS